MQECPNSEVSIEIWRVRLVRNIASFFLATNLFYMFIFLYLDQNEFLLPMILTTIGYGIAIFACLKRNSTVGTSLLLLSFNGIIAYSAAAVDVQSELALQYFFVCCIAPTILFDAKAWVSRIAFTMLPIALFTLISADILALKTIILDPSHIEILTWCVNFTIFANLIGLVALFESERTRYVAALKNVSKALKSESDSLRNTQKELLVTSRLATIGELSGNIAHEINNPITVVIMRSKQAIQLLKKEESPNAQVIAMLEKIGHTSHRIADIVRGMRNLSYDDREQDFGEIAVNEILESSIDLSKGDLDYSGISLKRVNPHEDRPIYCSQPQMIQVVMILIQNAVHALEGQKGPKEIRISSGNSEGFGWIAVANNGPEIPEDMQDKIMQPFYTTKAQGMGTGLGLSVATKIALRHGGSLSVKSSKLLTEFIIRVPNKQPAKIDAEAS